MCTGQPGEVSFWGIVLEAKNKIRLAVISEVGVISIPFAIITSWSDFLLIWLSSELYSLAFCTPCKGDFEESTVNIN